MSVDYAPPAGTTLSTLEHRCVRSGEWLIEGFTVELTGAGEWSVSWSVTGVDVELFPSFSAAVEWIAAEVGR